MDVSIVVPVYNAADFVGPRLTLLSNYLCEQSSVYELIVVDDGSSDGSAEIVEKLGLPRTRVLRSPGNEGKFGALIRGVAETQGSCVLFTDADVPYDLEAIPYMADVIRERGFHVALGDRTLAGSQYKETATWLRALVGTTFRYYTRLLVTGGIYDTQCGIKAFDGEVARLLFPLLHEHGFTGDVEVVYIALRYNLTIRRVPVRLVHEAPSSVKILRHGFEMVLSSIRIRGRYRAGLYGSVGLERLAAQEY